MNANKPKIQTGLLNDLIKQNFMDRIYIKGTDDFLKKCECELNQKITDIQLQCEGYSLFKPDEALDYFFKFFKTMIQQIQRRRTNSSVKTLKINLNGFKLKQNQQRIQQLAQQIESIRQNIKILWIHTSDLQNVSTKDFSSLLLLMFKFGADINNQQFSLQCANWKFTRRQLKFSQFSQVFQKLMDEQISQVSKLLQKHIRLQISGWWYLTADAKTFLQFSPDDKQIKQIDKSRRQYYKQFIQLTEQEKTKFTERLQLFYTKMQFLISNLMNNMPNIQLLEIDMRNMNELLNAKKLKQRIITNTMKFDRGEVSIVSMKQSISLKSSEQQKKFRLNVVM